MLGKKAKIATFLVAVLALPAMALQTIHVTNNNDSGAGSFRDALEQSGRNHQIQTIVFDGTFTIDLLSTLEYTAHHPLMIEAAGSTLEGALIGSGDVLLLTNSGSPIEINDMKVNRSPGHGIVLQTNYYANQTSVNAWGVSTWGSTTTPDNIILILNNVDVNGSSLYGVQLDDNYDPLDDGDLGSNAGVSLYLYDCNISMNGTGLIDYDGVRIDERGNGSIYARVVDCNIDMNGGDGFELDEGGAGDVVLEMFNSTLNDNGYFDEEDLDDGLDIDEAGDGDVDVTLTNVTALRNYDQGLDIDEEGEGDLKMTTSCTRANHNEAENMKLDEEDDGDMEVLLIKSTFNESADKEGVQMESIGIGQVTANLNDVEIKDNDNEGLKIEQEDEVNRGTVKIVDSDISGNDDDIDLTNVDQI